MTECVSQVSTNTMKIQKNNQLVNWSDQGLLVIL